MRSRVAIYGFLAFAATTVIVAPRALAQVVINEFVAASDGSFLDENGEPNDWIELLATADAPVDLSGWSLTDSADDDGWALPSLVLAPGETLVIFASGKDRRDPEGELHASFRLAADGEYLALRSPIGVVHEYAPYPPQREGLSYGLANESRVLVGAGDEADILAPATDDAGDWTARNYNPGASWLRGSTGIGYADANAPPLEDDALAGFWPFAGDLADVAQGNDGVFAGGAVRFAAGPNAELGAVLFDGVDDVVEVSPAPLFPVSNHERFSVAMWVNGLPQSDRRVFSEGSRSNSRPVFNIGTDHTGSTGAVDIFIRDDQGQVLVGHVHSRARAFDGSWHHLAWVDDSGRAKLYIDGALDLELEYAKKELALDRTAFGAILRDGLSFPFAGSIAAPAVWTRLLAPDEIERLASGSDPRAIGTASFADAIATDIGSELGDISPSAYVRLPFTWEPDEPPQSLVLRCRYDDGFAAYLNGSEVARRGAPAGALSAGSSAAANRPDELAARFEEIPLDAAGIIVSSGENVLAIHALDAAEPDAGFLVLPELHAVEPPRETGLYFREPTPGALNRGGSIDFVADTKFSHHRGFYADEIELSITSETQGAEIRYTLDGTAPAPDHGEVYAGTIRISTTTVVRAAAFKDGYEPTNVDTQSYFFPADILRQTAPAGYPSTWSGTPADYAMDPRIVGDPEYAADWETALFDLDTLSVVLDPDDLFGPNGIYENPTQSGSAWERAASLEILSASGERDLQIDCGARITGNRSRSPANSPKHGIRLIFRGSYGATKLEYPLFPGSPVERFDTIAIRPNAFDSWVSDNSSQRTGATYIRDEWVRSAQRDTGSPTPGSSFVHLYLNGLYWGLYNATERPDASFAAEHVGGDKDDFDAIKNHEEVVDGNIFAYRTLDSLRAAGVRDAASYARIEEYVDFSSISDYMIVNMFAPSTDWPGNYYMVRDRTGASGGFKFVSWDSEYAFLGSVENNRTLTHWRDADSPTKFYHALRENAEFRLFFADHVERHFGTGGILTVEAVLERWETLAGSIRTALVAESARWGDYRRSTPYRPDVEWERETQRLLTEYLPRRPAIVLEQFRAQGMYPEIEPPTFAPDGGAVELGARVSLSAERGATYYTLDGSDPRLPTGEVSPAARTVEIPRGDVILARGAPGRVHVPLDDSLGLAWTERGFDDAAWTDLPSAIGYERSSGYEDEIEGDVESILFGVNSSIFVRIPFDGRAAADADALTLWVQFDDGFVAYLNGEEIARRNAPDGALEWDSRASDSPPDAAAVEFQAIDVSFALSLLSGTDDVLALHGLNASTTSSDFLLAAELTAAQGATPGIQIDYATRVRARSFDGAEWSALRERTFVVDEPLPVRVTEIHYHPGGVAGDRFPADEFEFIEVQNVSERSVSLLGAALSEGVEFRFDDPAFAPLAPGETAIVVRNLEAFADRYPGPVAADRVAGEYGGRLDNAGEVLRLSDARGVLVQELAYDDAWYPSTDGGGASLEIVDARGPLASWSTRDGWAPSSTAGGTPGAHPFGSELEGHRRIGDANRDGSVNIADALAILGFLFGGSPLDALCERPAGANVVLDVNGDGGVDISDPIRLLLYLFSDGDPPPRGEGCVKIPGCTSACLGAPE